MADPLRPLRDRLQARLEAMDHGHGQLTLF